MGAVTPLKLDSSTKLPAQLQSGDNGLVVGQATLDASTLTAARTLTLPDASGTVLLNGKLPFMQADGTNSPIPLNSSNALPFTLADGTPTSIPMST